LPCYALEYAVDADDEEHLYVHETGAAINRRMTRR